MRRLYLKQKIIKMTDHFLIYDEYEKPIYKVDQDLKLIGHSVNVLNLENENTFKIERQLLKIMPRYTVTFSDGREFIIKQNFKLFKINVSLISSDFDLEIKGDFMSLNFNINSGRNLVGVITKKFLSFGDSFSVEVLDSKYQDALVAISIVLDRIIDDMQKNN